MLKKKAKGTQILTKCDKCGKKVRVLFDSDGKKVCAECLENNGGK
jgi:formylmethanofuran dehydrogenase subunit E